MTVETATWVNQLNSANPPGGDPKSEGDDHIRLIKSTLVASFPNIGGVVGAGHADLAAMGENFAGISFGSLWAVVASFGFLRKATDGVCYLNVGAACAAGGGARSSILTLPVGFRPSAAMQTTGYYAKNGAPSTTFGALFSVSTAGVVSLFVIFDGLGSPGATAGAGDSIYIDLSFPTR